MRTATSVRVWGLAQVIALVVLLAVVAVLSYYAIQTHEALCDLKADVQRRHDTTALLVEDIKEGRRPPIPGITTVDLDRSVANFKRTLESLDSLDCG